MIWFVEILSVDGTGGEWLENKNLSIAVCWHFLGNNAKAIASASAGSGLPKWNSRLTFQAPNDVAAFSLSALLLCVSNGRFD